MESPEPHSANRELYSKDHEGNQCSDEWAYLAKPTEAVSVKDEGAKQRLSEIVRQGKSTDVAKGP